MTRTNTKINLLRLHAPVLIRTVLAVHLLLAGFALPTVAQTQKKEERDLQRQREEWFYG